MKHFRLFGFALLLLCRAMLHGQANPTDSIRQALRKAQHDTTKVKLYISWGEKVYLEKPDSAIALFETAASLAEQASLNSKKPGEVKILKRCQGLALNNIGYIYDNQGHFVKALASYNLSLKICGEIGDKYGAAEALNNIGFIYKVQGDIPKALKCFNQSMKLREEIDNKAGIAISLNNIGLIYKSQGDIPKALGYYTRSLKLQEKIGDKSGMANSLHNIGGIYKDMKDEAKALEYFTRSLQLMEESGDKYGMPHSLMNIGGIYFEQENIPKALEYFNRALKIQEEIEDKMGNARSLNNIGAIYNKQGDIPKALEYFNKSLSIEEEIRDKDGTALSLNSIGEVYYKQKNYAKAKEYSERSMVLSKELGYPENIEKAAKLLYGIHKAMGKNDLALGYYEEYIAMRDSINSQENRKASIKSQFKYEYEKKAAADSVKVAEEKKVVAVQLKQEKTQRFALYGGLALVVLFAGFMVNRFRVTSKQKKIIELKEQETQKQNDIISHQKDLVEQKHREITDSINYAERIQRSFLATKELLDENLDDYFVFFKPKDIVSGDFYWAASVDAPTADGTKRLFYLATADSTGHGVPGAIMSLLNITSLEKATEHAIYPADILNHTRNTIIGRLKKDGSEDGGKDGMDCSLCVYDFAHKTLLVAAANNPVWIVRKKPASDVSGIPEGDVEVIEIKPDKMPVGKHNKEHIPFTQQEIQLRAGDVVYTLTDGFSDQFGGEKGKKFMSRNLRNLFANNAGLPMQQQKDLMERTFREWTGSMEQVDDVTIIGIRI